MIQKETNHPHYGEVIYDMSGYLTCHICGQGGFKALGTHVRQKHLDVIDNMRQYKIMFGLDVSKGILTQELRERKSNKVWENETILNLFSTKSIKSRFKPGSKGRTREQISEQTRRRLVTHGKCTIHNVRKENR